MSGSRTNPRRRLQLPVPTEHQEQKALFAWCATQFVPYPDLRWLYAIPNGGNRHPATAMLLKREGVKRGYPDVGLDVARGGFFGLRIELKRREGGELSPEQEAWRHRLVSENYCCVEVKGWVEASQVLVRYLSLPKTDVS